MKDIEDSFEIRSNINVWFEGVTKDNLVTAIDLLQHMFMVTEHFDICFSSII